MWDACERRLFACSPLVFLHSLALVRLFLSHPITHTQVRFHIYSSIHVHSPHRLCLINLINNYLCSSTRFVSFSLTQSHTLSVRFTAYSNSFFSKYYDCPVGDQDKTWAPHIVCSKCDITLKEWKKSKGKTQFSFVTLMYWMEVTDHKECYFCQTDLNGMNRNKRRNLVYPDVKSAKKPRFFEDDEARP